MKPSFEKEAHRQKPPEAILPLLSSEEEARIRSEAEKRGRDADRAVREAEQRALNAMAEKRRAPMPHRLDRPQFYRKALREKSEKMREETRKHLEKNL